MLFRSELGQPIVIDNRPGASAIIGVEAGAKSPPDGYTITLGGFSSHVINAFLFPKLPYDPVRDFVAITVMTRIPNLLSAHPSLPVKSVRELIAFAKTHPGQITYASSGSAPRSPVRTSQTSPLARRRCRPIQPPRRSSGSRAQTPPASRRRPCTAPRRSACPVRA